MFNCFRCKYEIFIEQLGYAVKEWDEESAGDIMMLGTGNQEEVHDIQRHTKYRNVHLSF